MLASTLQPSVPQIQSPQIRIKGPELQVDGQGLIAELPAQHRGTALIDIYDMSERRWFTEVVKPGDRIRISTAGWPVALYIVSWQTRDHRGHMLCARFPTYCVKVEPDFNA